jgi:hypothetical protein
MLRFSRLNPLKNRASTGPRVPLIFLLYRRENGRGRKHARETFSLRPVSKTVEAQSSHVAVSSASGSRQPAH